MSKERPSEQQERLRELLASRQYMRPAEVSSRTGAEQFRLLFGNMSIDELGSEWGIAPDASAVESAFGQTDLSGILANYEVCEPGLLEEARLRKDVIDERFCRSLLPLAYRDEDFFDARGRVKREAFEKFHLKNLQLPATGELYRLSSHLDVLARTLRKSPLSSAVMAMALSTPYDLQGLHLPVNPWGNLSLIATEIGPMLKRLRKLFSGLYIAESVEDRDVADTIKDGIGRTFSESFNWDERTFSLLHKDAESLVSSSQFSEAYGPIADALDEIVGRCEELLKDGARSLEVREDKGKGRQAKALFGHVVIAKEGANIGQSSERVVGASNMIGLYRSIRMLINNGRFPSILNQVYSLPRYEEVLADSGDVLENRRGAYIDGYEALLGILDGEMRTFQANMKVVKLQSDDVTKRAHFREGSRLAAKAGLLFALMIDQTLLFLRSELHDRSIPNLIREFVGDPTAFTRDALLTSELTREMKERLLHFAKTYRTIREIAWGFKTATRPK